MKSLLAGLPLASLLLATPASAQIAYSVTSSGSLVRFDASAPSVATTIGSLGFTPVGIDFNPASGSLYALSIGPNASQLYTVDLATGAATTVGSGFASSGTGYDLTGASSFGFDFDPNSLQIRLTDANGSNLRLDATTGQIAGIDSDLNGYTGLDIGGSAYASDGKLYAIDYAADRLLLQTPAAGDVTQIGSGLGVNIGSDIGFDIISSGQGDVAYLTNATASTTTLYQIDLTTGTATSLGTIPGRLTGGLAFEVAAVPEPANLFAGLLGVFGLTLAWRRRRARA